MPAPVPSFQSYASLRAALRLTGVVDGSDAELQLQAAVRESWTVFWRGISVERIAALAALPHVEPPTTEDHMLRVLAETTEQQIVRRSLLRVYAAGTTEARTPTQEWNVEGLLRGASTFSTSRIIEDLTTEIEQAFELLRGSESASNETSVSVAVPESDDVKTNGPRGIGYLAHGREGVWGAL